MAEIVNNIIRLEVEPVDFQINVGVVSMLNDNVVS